MSKSLTDIKTWIKFVLIGVVLPLFILLCSLRYVNELKYNKAKEELSLQSTNILSEYKKRYAHEAFISEQISKIYNTSKDVKSLKKKMLAFRNDYKIGCKFLIWDSSQKFYFSSFDLSERALDWMYAYDLLYQIKVHGKYKSGDNIPEAINRRLTSLFGPLFVARYNHFSYSKNKLLYNSISNDYPLLWVKIKKKSIGLIVQFDIDKLTRDNVLKATTEQFAKWYPKLSFAVINDNKCMFANQTLTKVVNNNLPDIKNPYTNIIDDDKFIFNSSKIGFKCTAVVFIDKKNLHIEWHNFSKLLLFIILVFAMLITYKSYQVIVLHVRIYLTIKRKLLLLFVLFGLMPPFLLLVLSYDYLQQYKISERAKVYLNGSRYLRHLDDMYSTELTHQIILLKNAKFKLKQSLKIEGLTHGNLQSFLKSQNPVPFRLALIGSSTSHYGTDYGIIKNNKLISKFRLSENAEQKHVNYTKIMAKLASFLLKTINKSKISKKDATELEFVADAMGKVAPVDLMHNFFSKMNGFWNVGFGARQFPGFIDDFRIFNQNIIDYVLFYTWRPNGLTQSLVYRKITDFNRNSLNLKILAQFEDTGCIIPKEYSKNLLLKSYADKLNEKNGSSIIKYMNKNKEYYLMGLKCSYIPSLKLIGIYPKSIINKKIIAQRNSFIILAIINFLVSVSFGLFISRIILSPLFIVRRGIEKMKNKEFNFRLPFLGNNEFGDLSKILNETMSDFEELQTAGDFKKKLFGKLDETVNFGSFHIFTTELSLSEFNGNYFDLSEINENAASILFGTVYEEGIASGLITAYIKSCSVQLEYCNYDVREYLLKLNMLLSHIQHLDVQSPYLSYFILDSENKKVSIDKKSLCNGFLINGNRCANALEKENVLVDGDVIIIFSEQLSNRLRDLGINTKIFAMDKYSENIEKFSFGLKEGLSSIIDEMKPNENFMLISVCI